MGILNIYKVDNDKLEDLMQTLNQKMQQIGTQTITEAISETGETQTIRGELYYAQQENPVSLSWDWVLAAFGQESVRTNPYKRNTMQNACLTFLWSGIMDLKTMIALQFLLATERLKSWISTRQRQCLRSKLAAHRESCAMLLTNHWKL